MNDGLALPEYFVARARDQAQLLMGAIFGLQSVVVSTEDGAEVASVVRDGQDSARIAAVVSSVAAITVLVAQEASLGKARSVTMDTESGFAVIFAVPRPDRCLILSIIASQDVLIGEVMYRAAHLARLLSKL